MNCITNFQKPVVDIKATGEKIRQLMVSRSLCVRDHEHVPMIERTKDGKYKVWEKFKKLNHDWEG